VYAGIVSADTRAALRDENDSESSLDVALATAAANDQLGGSGGDDDDNDMQLSESAEDEISISGEDTPLKTLAKKKRHRDTSTAPTATTAATTSNGVGVQTLDEVRRERVAALQARSFGEAARAVDQGRVRARLASAAALHDDERDGSNAGADETRRHLVELLLHGSAPSSPPRSPIDASAHRIADAEPRAAFPRLREEFAVGAMVLRHASPLAAR
jgi:hypothetical protein